MALTKSDFEKYRVNEVLARSKDANWPFSFLGTFQDELKRCEQAGDETGIGLFSLLSHISWMHLGPHEIDPKAPLNPMPQLGEAHLEILDAIVGEISVTTMRGHIADVLWLCRYGGNKKHEFASIAYDSYLESIDDESLDLWMESRLERALQLATKLYNPKKPQTSEKLDRALEKAQEITDKRLIERDWATWERLTRLLATYSKNGQCRIMYIEQICRKATEAECEEKLELAARFKEDALNLFGIKKNRKFRKPARVQNLRLDLVKTLVALAEQEASSEIGWAAFSRAKSKIEQAISHHKKAQGASHSLEDMNASLAHYSAKVAENMDWKTFTWDMGKDLETPLDMREEKVAEELQGKTFKEALILLAAFPYPICAEEIRKVAKDHSQGSLSSLFGVEELNRVGKVVGREGHFSVGGYASFHRLVHAKSVIQPAVKQITDEHEIKIQDIGEILVNSVFVPQHSIWTFAHGLLAGFRFDLVTVAHVLPPMIENAMRELLGSYGVNTSDWDDKFVSEERSLGWVLDQKEIANLLGEDLLFDLRTLLLPVEGGLNLRNRVAHGLQVDSNYFPLSDGGNSHTLAQVMYLWWLTLRLCLYHQAYEHFTTHDVASPSP